MVADKFTEVTLRNLFLCLSAFQLCFGGFVIFIKCYQTSNLIIGRGSYVKVFQIRQVLFPKWFTSVKTVHWMQFCLLQYEFQQLMFVPVFVSPLLKIKCSPCPLSGFLQLVNLCTILERRVVPFTTQTR